MVTIDDVSAPTPVYDEVAAQYRVLEQGLNAAAKGDAALAVVRRWDALRRGIETWSNLVNLKFSQDTMNEQFKKEREYCDEITPRLTDLDDYTAAQTCALQFWVRAQSDLPGTMAAYHALCARGGEAPFQELVRSAGLTSPFQPGCLRGVVEQARLALQG